LPNTQCIYFSPQDQKGQACRGAGSGGLGPLAEIMGVLGVEPPFMKHVRLDNFLTMHLPKEKGAKILSCQQKKNSTTILTLFKYYHLKRDDKQIVAMNVKMSVVKGVIHIAPTTQSILLPL